MFDHEILETLLFFARPRVNTKPLAHELLERFGSLNEIFNAGIDEIKEVDGAGEVVAEYLKIIGAAFARAGSVEGVARLKSFGDCKKFVSMRLKNKQEEVLELYFLDKGGKVKRQFHYTSFDRNKAVADSGEVMRSISVSKPFSILAAHNHLNFSAEPSDNDDDFTKQLQLICNLSDVVLLDHIIYADGNFYSYKDSGRLDEIKQSCTLNNFIKWTRNSN